MIHWMSGGNFKQVGNQNMCNIIQNHQEERVISFRDNFRRFRREDFPAGLP